MGTGAGSSLNTAGTAANRMPSNYGPGAAPGRQYDEEQVDFSGQQQILDMQQNDEIVISAAMQQLRDPGVLIVAHGSRGKPKTVRLQLTESAVTWRTETRKKGIKNDPKPKMGKLHQVPLSHIMYVDVGKQISSRFLPS